MTYWLLGQGSKWMCGHFFKMVRKWYPDDSHIKSKIRTVYWVCVHWFVLSLWKCILKQTHRNQVLKFWKFYNCERPISMYYNEFVPLWRSWSPSQLMAWYILNISPVCQATKNRHMSNHLQLRDGEKLSHFRRDREESMKCTFLTSLLGLVYSPLFQLISALSFKHNTICFARSCLFHMGLDWKKLTHGRHILDCAYWKLIKGFGNK